VIIMLGTEPSFSEDLLGRALVAAESLGITPLILLNKIDLTARLETARSRLALYRELGYTIVELTVHGAPEAAHAALEP
ncbi:GTPase RsgA, partial [Mycobacterium tuberculosis]|nr:GTPase RsgA [Mycobacterium tuberculosis]